MEDKFGYHQDIKNGDGCCYIDPHGTDIQTILSRIPKERINDVIYFDPAYSMRPMGLNMLEYDPKYPEQKTFVVNEMMGIFNKLFDMKIAGGPMFEQYFRNSVMLVLEDPESGNTLLDVSRVLSNKQFRDLKISKCKNPLVVQFWKEIAEKAGGEASLANIVPYIVSKFDVFLQNDIMRPIIAQEKSSFNFREIMDKKKILLIDDDHDFISAIATMLTVKGYEIKIAYNSDEGYEVAQIFKPDLFILDVNMETNSAGFELNKKLRSSADFSSTPIIILTGVDTMVASNMIVDMYNEMEGIDGFKNDKVLKVRDADGTVGVDYKTDSGQRYFLLLDSFIGKPVESDQLLKEIKKFLKD